MRSEGEKVVRAIARGRVQGVGFRWYVREAARRAGIRGWVRNCPDGSVEVLAAGEPAAVESVIEAMRRGPAASRVDAVDVRPVAGEPIPDKFLVH